MRARWVVQTRVGDSQFLDHLAVQNRAIDDTLHILHMDMAVPDALRINDNCGTVLALIHTAGVVGSNAAGEAAAFDLALKGSAEFLAGIGVAATSGMTGWPGVSTNEKMMGIGRHQGGLSRMGGCRRGGILATGGGAGFYNGSDGV